MAKKVAAKKAAKSTGEAFVFLNVRTTKAVKAAVLARAKKDGATINAVVGAALGKYL